MSPWGGGGCSSGGVSDYTLLRMSRKRRAYQAQQFLEELDQHLTQQENSLYFKLGLFGTPARVEQIRGIINELKKIIHNPVLVSNYVSKDRVKELRQGGELDNKLGDLLEDVKYSIDHVPMEFQNRHQPNVG